MSGTNDWPLAEIISIKELPESATWYYVHYVDCKGSWAECFGGFDNIVLYF